MAPPMTPRLNEFRIDGLFGLYSHVIPLNNKERITIIIGPNGRGKTVCLKCIEALFRGRYGYFATVPFRSADFLFSGGEQITVRRAVPDQPAESSKEIEFELNAPGQEA